jgi:cell division protease FtsH
MINFNYGLKKYHINKKYVNYLLNKNLVKIEKPFEFINNPKEETFESLFDKIVNKTINKKEYIKKILPQDYKYSNSKKKSDNFEVLSNVNFSFNDIGGYNNIKEELYQCIDFLKYPTKYEMYNVRLPKGLIFEGPPGTGKTLFAKALAGEANCSFIAVSGSDFQEKYVGVGSTRVKELFKLAKENQPCIIFIDEVDAIGRKRSSEELSGSVERDTTLNALLVEMDGFKSKSSIFVISATNRIDLLDNALVRPGRFDKKIFIGLPDKKTRESIISIHIKGKSYDNNMDLESIIDLTEGLSGAEIENTLNEAMLFTLRKNNTYFTYSDMEYIINKMILGWQSNEHILTDEMIDYVCVHEMGHFLSGYFSKFHPKVKKAVIYLSSPKNLGLTTFSKVQPVQKKEELFEHIVVLLSGRVAEELFYNQSITTGATEDLKYAKFIAEDMIIKYGMGSLLIYPENSHISKEMIDNDIHLLIRSAYNKALFILSYWKDVLKESSLILKEKKIITVNDMDELILSKYMKLYEQFTNPSPSET